MQFKASSQSSVFSHLHDNWRAKRNENCEAAYRTGTHYVFFYIFYNYLPQSNEMVLSTLLRSTYSSLSTILVSECI